MTRQWKYDAFFLSTNRNSPATTDQYMRRF